MKGLLEKIYREVIYFEEDTVQMENRLAGKIEELLAPYRGKLDEGQMMEFRAVVYEAALAAESKAFWLGVRYAAKFFGKL